MASAAMLLCAWWILLPAPTGLPDRAATQLSALVYAFTCGLLLTTGVLLAGRWRLTGDRCAAPAAAALLLGAALPVLAIVGPLLHSAPDGTTHATTARLLLILPTLAVLAAGARSERISSIRPPLLAAVLFSGWLATVTLLSALPEHERWLWGDAHGQVAFALQCLAGYAWALLAWRSWQQGRREIRASGCWIAFALTLMAASAAAEVCSIMQRRTPYGLVPVLQLAAAVIVAATAATDLHTGLRTMTGRRLRVADSLGELHALLSDVEDQHRQRLHDTSTAVVAAVAASRLLSEPAGLAPADRERLGAMMSAELLRLQTTLDPDLVEPIVEFALVDALEPVLLAHHLCGAAVRSDLAGLRVLGRPSSTATVVANLLGNVRAHAPGAAVEVRAARRGTGVVITVEDDGPGIPLYQRQRVMQHGIQVSPRHPGGLGLGLYTAAAAMASQSGSLLLGERPGGGTRVVLRMPAAQPMASLARPAAARAG